MYFWHLVGRFCPSVVCAGLLTWKDRRLLLEPGPVHVSIVARPGGEAAVARVQKWGMVVAVASVVVAFSLRVCMMPAVAA